MNTNGALVFLINTILSFFTIVMLARIILPLVRADFYNPISQFVFKATNPILMPLQKFLPMRPIDVAAVLLFFVLVALQITTKFLLLHQGGFPNAPQFIVILFIASIGEILDFFLFSIIIMAILSWISMMQPGGFNPIYQLLQQITDPVIAPFRKIIPPMGGLDLSPMAAIISIYFLRILFGI